MQKAMREAGIGLAHRTHPEDQPLYDNLPSLSDTSLSLYYEPSHPYALEF